MGRRRGTGGGPISSPSIGGFVDPTRTFPPPRRAPFPTRVLRGSPHLHVASTLRHQRIPPPGPVTYHSEIWPLGSAYLDRSSGWMRRGRKKPRGEQQPHPSRRWDFGASCPKLDTRRHLPSFQSSNERRHSRKLWPTPRRGSKPQQWSQNFQISSASPRRSPADTDRSTARSFLSLFCQSDRNFVPLQHAATSRLLVHSQPSTLCPQLAASHSRAERFTEISWVAVRAQPKTPVPSTRFHRPSNLHPLKWNGFDGAIPFSGRSSLAKIKSNGRWIICADDATNKCEPLMNWRRDELVRTRSHRAPNCQSGKLHATLPHRHFGANPTGGHLFSTCVFFSPPPPLHPTPPAHPFRHPLNPLSIIAQPSPNAQHRRDFIQISTGNSHPIPQCPYLQSKCTFRKSSRRYPRLFVPVTLTRNCFHYASITPHFPKYLISANQIPSWFLSSLLSVFNWIVYSDPRKTWTLTYPESADNDI